MESYVQWIIRIDILRFPHLRDHSTKFCDVSQSDTTCSQPARQAEEMSAHVINLCCLSDAHFFHEHATIRNHFDQVAFFETSTSFPYRSAANAEDLRECALVNAISSL